MSDENQPGLRVYQRPPEIPRAEMIGGVSYRQAPPPPAPTITEVDPTQPKAVQAAQSDQREAQMALAENTSEKARLEAEITEVHKQVNAANNREEHRELTRRLTDLQSDLEFEQGRTVTLEAMVNRAQKELHLVTYGPPAKESLRTVLTETQELTARLAEITEESQTISKRLDRLGELEGAARMGVRSIYGEQAASEIQQQVNAKHQKGKK